VQECEHALRYVKMTPDITEEIK